MDLLIEGAAVIDGTGTPAAPGSVGVRGERIAWVGRPGERRPPAARRIDAGGRAVCPGFVDVHTHSDLVPLVEPRMDSALRQGVTTVVVGNCGSSAWPPAGAREVATMIGARPGDLSLRWRSFADYLDAIAGARPAVNLAVLIGLGSLRMEVMGMARRPPAADELSRMVRLLEDGLEAGAVGLSSGLVYAPDMYADIDELTALASALGRRGGVYATHIRGEGEPLFEAVAEALEVGRRTKVPVHISHLKCETRLTWGRAGKLLRTLREARSSGIDVTADQYPYTAWATGLSSFLPPWAPVEDLPGLLEDAQAGARLARAVEEGEPGWQSTVKGVGWERIVVESSGVAGAAGRSIADLAAERGQDPTAAALALLAADPDTAVIGHAMSEEDVRAILSEGEVMVASDGWAMSPGGPMGASPVHPRNYGTFPRVLGRYVREEGLLTPEMAVRKMTSLPADRFGLMGRGRIEVGAAADLVLVDLDRVRDTATFGNSHRFPEGIDLVVVNGRVAWDGEGTGERAGRIVRRGAR